MITGINKGHAVGVLFVASFAALFTVEQTRIKHLRETAAFETIRADWEAAGSAYSVNAAAMLRVLENLHCIFVLSDTNDAPLQSSAAYREIRAPWPPAYDTEPRTWKFTAAPKPPTPLQGARFVFLTGAVRDRDKKVYQLTVGKPLS